jgi:hypothetical protein
LISDAIVAAPEAVVDVDDRHAERTAVQHAEQRRDAAEAGAVADARRHGDDRHATRPATTLGSAPSMPATTMITRAAARRARSPSSGGAGDADVVQPVDVVAHQLGRRAASSATGRSDVPAAATTIVPLPA